MYTVRPLPESKLAGQTSATSLITESQSCPRTVNLPSHKPRYLGSFPSDNDDQENQTPTVPSLQSIHSNHNNDDDDKIDLTKDQSLESKFRCTVQGYQHKTSKNIQTH